MVNVGSFVMVFDEIDCVVDILLWYVEEKPSYK